MIALGIRYLTKYAVATNLALQRPEWPPHWGRTFMAMTAGHFEGGEAEGEREALEWLEAAPAPALCASDADERTLVRAYVPVNDDHGGIFRRARHDRSFRRTRPHGEYVYFIWDCEPGAEIRAALERLCQKVTRIGDSSSAVQMWVVPEGQVPAPNWIPSDWRQNSRMRVTESGTLHSLEAAFNGPAIQEHDALAEALAGAKGKQKADLEDQLKANFPSGRPERRRPILVRWQGYLRAEVSNRAATVASGPLDEEFVVLTKFDGMTLGLESTLQLTGALRNAAMKAASDPPEWLSGHDRAGLPSLENHATFFPLPYVGFKHADGHILGMGMALPRGLKDSVELRRVLGPLFFDPDTGEDRPVQLWRRDHEGNKVWRWELRRETRERPPINLQRPSWTEPSRIWASVTPVVFHHYPKNREGDAERIVKEAFVSAQFPEPEAIQMRSISAVSGAGHAMALPPFAVGGASLCRYQTHVAVRFVQPVRGPMLVGRGRFRGYGLFWPLREDRV